MSSPAGKLTALGNRRTFEGSRPFLREVYLRPGGARRAVCDVERLRARCCELEEEGDDDGGSDADGSGTDGGK